MLMYWTDLLHKR